MIRFRPLSFSHRLVPSIPLHINLVRRHMHANSPVYINPDIRIYPWINSIKGPRIVQFPEERNYPAMPLYRSDSVFSGSIYHRPSTHAADISYILDPSYASCASTSMSAYMDDRGNLHDPDYRAFPPPPVISPSSSFSQSQIGPIWESDAPFQVDNALKLVLYPIPISSTPSHRSSSSYSCSLGMPQPPRRRGHRDSVSTSDSASYIRSYSTQYPSSSAPTSDSFISPPLYRADSPFEAYLADREHASAVEILPAVQTPEQEQAADDIYIAEQQQQNRLVRTSTRGQGLKKHWEAISMRVRFSVFHAHKTIRRRMSRVKI